MKKIYIVFIILINTLVLAGQNDLGKDDDYERIALDIYIPEQVETIPEHDQSLLESKLTQVATNYGLGREGIDSRFLLTAKIEALSKDITATAPPMEAYTLEVYLYIVDHIEKTILATTSFTVKGAGTNKNKAYTNGLKTINSRNRDIERFLASGKQKIISYYNSRCDFIIAEAKSLAAQNRFDEALISLSSIPEVCKECYIKSLEAIEPIFQDYIDHECSTYLNIASGLFAANPNRSGAMDAIEVLAWVDPDSKCFEEANSLIEKIEQKMRSDEDRNWRFRERVWNDKTELERLRINAYRDVGVAFGRNQQPQYNILWLFD